MRKLNCQGESFSGQIDKLKGEVRMMFHKVVDPLERLELIDILQRLGISYHFDDEIRRTLEDIHNANHGGELCNNENIYATALEFRLLRQHGYSVPQGKQLTVILGFRKALHAYAYALLAIIAHVLQLLTAIYAVIVDIECSY